MNALGHITFFNYDADGKLASTALDTGDQHVLTEAQKPRKRTHLPHANPQVDYDANGNSARLTLGHYSVSWEYGPMNRVERRIEGKNQITSYHYNAEGLCGAIVKPDGTTLHYQYTAGDRVSELFSSDHTVHYKLHYDLHGQIIHIDDLIHNTTTQRAFNAQGQLEREWLANHLEVAIHYDQDRRTGFTFPDQSGVRYLYSDNKLSEVQRVNKQGNVQYTHHYNKQSAEMIANLGTITYTYDEGKLLGLSSPYYSTQTTVTPDTIQTTSQDIQGSYVQNYQLDAAQQITAETGLFSHQYQYDALQNRTAYDGTAWSVNSLNQLTHAGSITLTYDANGNLTRKKTPQHIYDFTYDALDRLIAVTIDRKKNLQYSYDFFSPTPLTNDRNRDAALYL